MTRGEFTIAVNDGYGEKRKTTFINVECWGKAAVYVSKYLQKGDAVIVQGKIWVDKYQDQNGNTRQNMGIVANNVQGLEKRKKAEDTVDMELHVSDVNASKIDEGDMPF